MNKKRRFVAALAAIAAIVSSMSSTRPLVAADRVELAQASDPVRLAVTASCTGGFALFTVVNEGELWSQMSKISVYRTDGRTLVSQRSIRMTKGQRMSFKVKGSPASPVELGIWIEPSWYQRDFAYDAKIVC